MNYARKLFALAILILMFTVATSMAVVPSTINYQGRLTDDAGNPVDTTVDMTFSICLDSAGLACIWGETQDSVVVTDGLFNVKLGADSALTDEVFNGDNRWLHVRVGFQPIEPPTELITTPYAFRVSTVDGSSGGLIIGDVNIVTGLRGPGDLYVAGDVGIGTTSPQGALDVNSTSGALVVPRMTTVQRDAITATDGMVIYNTTDNQFDFYENGAWVTK